jgi:hypothetical protein
MAKHKKPTLKELNEQINDTLKKVDEEVKEPEGDKTSKEESETDETPKQEEVEEPTEEKPEKPQEPDKEPYKKRYEDSTREAQVLYSKSKKMSDAITKAGEIPEPTEEELIGEFKDWEVMSDFERQIAKDSVWNKKKLNAISDVAKDFKDMDAWNTRIDEFLVDPEVLASHPELEDREGDFKIFASRETRRGVDFEDLVSAFLYTEDYKPKPRNTGSMFETGSGGINEKPEKKDNKIPFDEGQRLKISNYKMYIRLLREDKISSPEV